MVNRGFSSMSKRSRPEVVDEQVPADGQGETRLPGLRAQDVGVEQPQIAPLVHLRPELVQHRSLDEQTKPTQPLGVQPFLVVLLTPLLGERVDSCQRTAVSDQKTRYVRRQLT